jgi:Tfp pilus assembly protein PilX
VIRREDGLATVAVLGVVLALLLVGAAALDLSQRRTASSARERDAVRAAAAADAAMDVAGLRMNRALVSTGVADLASLPADAVRRLGCLAVVADRSVPGATLTADIRLGSADWCPVSEWEDLGDGTQFRYTVGTQLEVTPELVVRRVLAEGRSGRVVRRVLATYELDVDLDVPTRLFERSRFVVCTAAPDAARADAGCPDPDRAG